LDQRPLIKLLKGKFLFKCQMSQYIFVSQLDQLLLFQFYFPINLLVFPFWDVSSLIFSILLGPWAFILSLDGFPQINVDRRQLPDPKLTKLYFNNKLTLTFQMMIDTYF
jgi:hypothetical protein